MKQIKWAYSFVLVWTAILSCEPNLNSVSDYENTLVKFINRKVFSKNKEFSIVIPHKWLVKEEQNLSDTALYLMEAIDTSRVISTIIVMKIKSFEKKVEEDFEKLQTNYQKQLPDMQLVEKTKIQVNEKLRLAVHYRQRRQKELLAEEIDILIPFDNESYYLIGLFAQNSKDLRTTFGMLMTCVKTFELI